MGVVSVLYSLAVIKTDSPEVMLVALTESRSSRPFEDWVWFCWVVVVVVLVVVIVLVVVPAFIIVRKTPNPTMMIIAITTRLVTPKETAPFAFANVEPH